MMRPTCGDEPGGGDQDDEAEVPVVLPVHPHAGGLQCLQCLSIEAVCVSVLQARLHHTAGDSFCSRHYGCVHTTHYTGPGSGRGERRATGSCAAAAARLVLVRTSCRVIFYPDTLSPNR